MKKLLMIILTIGLINTAIANEIYGPETVNMDKYVINLKHNSTATIQVGLKKSYGCSNELYFTKVQNGNEIIILAKPLYHTMDVCDFPIERTEGIEFNIFSGIDTPTLYNIYVPKGFGIIIK